MNTCQNSIKQVKILFIIIIIYIIYVPFFSGYYDLYGVGEMDETDLSLIGVSDQQHRNFLSEEIKKLSDTNLLPKNTQ